jgi:thioredoxin 1
MNRKTIMKKHPMLNLAIAGLLVLGAALVLAQTNKTAGVTSGACCPGLTNPALLASVVATATNAPANPPANPKLPKLLDLGAGKCVPCKMMAPILDQMKKDYAGSLEVEFIDVWKNRDAAKQYGVEMIPTQIFFDSNGKELFRHTGFFSKEDILAKWKELGVDLKAAK